MLICRFNRGRQTTGGMLTFYVCLSLSNLSSTGAAGGCAALAGPSGRISRSTHACKGDNAYMREAEFSSTREDEPEEAGPEQNTSIILSE
jgi:hypothetical protein